MLESKKQPNDCLSSEMTAAINNNDVFMVNRLAANLDEKMLTLAFFVAIYSGKEDICRFLVKKGICLFASIKSSSARWDHSTPLIDALRRQYFDIAERIFKMGYRIDFSQDAEVVTLYEMLLACNDVWFDRITKRNPSFNKLSFDELNQILIYTIADDNDTLFEKIISNHKDYDDSKIIKFLCLAVQDGAVKIVDSILNRRLGSLLNIKVVHQIIYLLLSNKRPRLPPRSKLFERMRYDVSCQKNHYIKYANSISKKALLNERKGKILSKLLTYSHDIDYQSEYGDSFLHYAVFNDNRNCVEIILKHGANVNIFNNLRRTPLYYSRSVEMTRTLLKEEPRVNILDVYNVSPLEAMLPQKHRWLPLYAVLPYSLPSAFEIIDKYPDALIDDSNLKRELKCFLDAAYEGQSLWFLKYIVEKSKRFGVGSKLIGEVVFNIIEKDRYLRVSDRLKAEQELSPNCVSVFDVKMEMLTLLCQGARDINYVNKVGENALHRALLLDLPLDIIKLLVDAGVNINQADVNGITPIFYASNMEVFNLLIKSGANINSRDKDGCTPFIAAIIRGQSSIANNLFKMEEEHFLSDKCSSDCFTASAAFNFDNLPLGREIYTFLIAQGMNFVGKDVDGLHYLHRAWRDGNICFIREYLFRNFDINLSDDLGNNLLFYTESQGDSHKDILPQMIKSGLDLNKRNNNGQTCVHYLLQKEMSADEKREYRIEKEVWDPSKNYRGRSLENITLSEEDYSYFSSIAEEKINFLMNFGASINLLDGMGRNILHYIAMNEGLDPLFCHLKVHFDESEFNRKDNLGKTPLHLLFERENGAIKGKVLNDILNAGADPNIPNADGESAFDCLSKRVDKNVSALSRILNSGRRPLS